VLLALFPVGRILGNLRGGGKKTEELKLEPALFTAGPGFPPRDQTKRTQICRSYNFQWEGTRGGELWDFSRREKGNPGNRSVITPQVKSRESGGLLSCYGLLVKIWHPISRSGERNGHLRRDWRRP